jgi:hypothetical protein
VLFYAKCPRGAQTIKTVLACTDGRWYPSSTRAVELLKERYSKIEQARHRRKEENLKRKQKTLFLTCPQRAEPQLRKTPQESVFARNRAESKMCVAKKRRDHENDQNTDYDPRIGFYQFLRFLRTTEGNSENVHDSENVHE